MSDQSKGVPAPAQTKPPIERWRSAADYPQGCYLGEPLLVAYADVEGDTLFTTAHAHTTGSGWTDWFTGDPVRNVTHWTAARRKSGGAA